MYIKMIPTPGLAHLSYIVGDAGEAAVIDPRRDVDIYLQIARSKGLAIKHIFETHRNEDYVIGSQDLSRQTGADIYHGKNAEFGYGNTVREGDRFEVGRLRLVILETPGHTYESISITLADTSFALEPFAVFTGDTLFVGDVGRTDFFPDKKEQVAGLLYDSIFKKILPLGDHVILHPAHGGGSVCGSNIADRNLSTLGFERKHNPVLQKKDRDEFIAYKVQEHHPMPPYFRQMEKMNREGSTLEHGLPQPTRKSPDQFAQAIKKGMVVVDVRSPEAFGGAHIPASLSIPLDALSAFAGWYLQYDEPIGLVVDTPDQVETAVRHLVRIGYENIAGYLDNGLDGWTTSGRDYQSLPEITIHELVGLIHTHEPVTILDVRKREEFRTGHLPGAKNIYVGELPDHLSELSRSQPIVTVCSSGMRAGIAASILLRNDFTRVRNALGPMKACAELACPIVIPDGQEVAG